MILDIIKRISEASGDEKMGIMAAHPELKDTMELAYNPFKKYNITVSDEAGNNQGIITTVTEINGALFGEPASLLTRLCDRTLSGNEAKEAVSNYIDSLSPDSAELFKMIINKDLRCGISSKTINKVWPGLIQEMESGDSKPSIMNLHAYDEKRCPFPVFAGEKEDGDRGRFANRKLCTRQGKLYKGLQHIEDQLNMITEYMGPNFSEFDGELIVPGYCQSEGSGLLRSHNDAPDAVIRLFDCPSFPGTKVERWNAVQKTVAANKDILPNVSIIHHRVFETKEDLMAYSAGIELTGGEGLVVCNPDSLYEDKRSYDWTRLVPIKTADCKVIGFEEGKGKLTDSLGKILVDYKGHTVGVGSGFKEKFYNELSDKEKEKILLSEEEYNNTVRLHIWRNQGQFMGWIAKCNFKEETKKGSMRQPTFDCWRYDKTEPSFN